MMSSETNIENGRVENVYLSTVIQRFHEMKKLAERALTPLNQSELNWIPHQESNSIATIVKHLHGNMLSRWTDFLTTDGEKPSRERDAEFNHEILDQQTLLQLWDSGWSAVFLALEQLQPSDLLKTITIRNEPHFVIEAIERQMYHYSYHVGQIVYISKLLQEDRWQALTLPRKK